MNAPARYALPPRSPWAHDEVTDYEQGWSDYRTYSGRSTCRSDAYNAGYDRCSLAFRTGLAMGKGMGDLPLRPPVAS